MVKEIDIPNGAIKDYVVGGGPKGWKYAEKLEWAYWMQRLIATTFFGPKDETQQWLPQPVISIDKLGVKTYAAYRLTFNGEGIPFNIILGEEWIERPLRPLVESIAHETTHFYLDWLAKKESGSLMTCSKVAHGKEFCGIAEQIGFHPVPNEGWHWRPADGQLERLMDLCMLPPLVAPKGVVYPTDPPKGLKGSYWGDPPKGKSSLHLYMCDICPKRPVCKWRNGRTDGNINCGDCKGTFTLHGSF